MSEPARDKDRPWQDPIVAEVRAARQELLAQVGYDLHALCELLRSHQAAAGRHLVRRPPRPVESSRTTPVRGAKDESRIT
jgi:hypothetical protein